MRNEFALKIFFGRSSRPEVLAGHVKYVLRAMRKRESTFDQVDREMNESPRPGLDRIHHRIALEKGRALTRARIEWSERALVMLDDASRG